MKSEAITLPYGELEKIGLSQDKLTDLFSNNYNRFLEGETSPLTTLNLKDSEGKLFNEQAKLSLYKNQNGDIDILIHPKRDEIKNDLNLSQNKLDDLRNGKIITHTMANYENILVQLDLETNELRSVPQKNIIIPDKIQNTSITKKQKEDLLQGKQISIYHNNGQSSELQVDLLNQTSVKIAHRENITQSNNYDNNTKQSIKR